MDVVNTHSRTSPIDGPKKINISELVCLAVGPSKYSALFPLDEFRGFYYTNKFLLSVTFVIFVLYFVLTIVVKFFTNSEFEVVKFNAILNAIQTLFMFWVPIVSVYRLVSQQEVLNECLKTLKDLEAMLAKVGPLLEMKHNFIFLYLEIVFLLGAIFTRIAKNTVDEISIVDTTVFTIYYTSLLCSMYSLAHRYTCILSICKQLFSSCNKAVVSCSAASRAGKLTSIAFVHSSLCSLSLSYSTLEMPHILLILLSSFIISITELYKFLAVMRKDTQFQFLALVIKICWVGIGSTVIWNIVSSCSSCSKEAKEFTVLLYQLMLEDRNSGICNNMKLQLHISMKREVVFTACEFFVIDYTLIHSMVAAATTYLVILIQFAAPTGKPEESNESNATSTLQ